MSEAMNKMDPNFNYGDITDEHKHAAKEIANLMEGMNQPMMAELIRERFQITPIPKYDFTQHPFVKACEKANLFCAVQGHVKDGSGKMEYPVISISDDVRKFEDLFQIIVNEYSQ